MTPLHTDLLFALHAAKPAGLTAELLTADMRRLRHRHVSIPEIEKALRDLADISLATPMHGILSDRWRITALGSSALNEEGIA